MSYRSFTMTTEDGVALLTLSRPEDHNAMGPDFWRELPEAVGRIEGAARVLVIASSGRHFSSGMDLSVLAGAPGTGDARARLGLREMVLGLQESFTALERARLPVLAAIQGGCIGAALDLVTACDCRYAVEDAYFVIQEINLGMVADVGAFPRLCKLMSEGMVRQMAFTGEKLAATEAVALGLVNKVFADQKGMLDAVMATARVIAEKSPLAVAGTKRMINYARDHSVADCLDYVATWQAGMFDAGADLSESLAARMEKRAPRYGDLAPRAKPFEK